MTDLRDWLATREPPAPDTLREALAERAGDAVPGSARALLARGLDCLRAARSAPGRVRASARELLAADAWITWAAEAALETDDPSGALERQIAAVAGDDPG